MVGRLERDGGSGAQANPQQGAHGVAVGTPVSSADVTRPDRSFAVTKAVSHLHEFNNTKMLYFYSVNTGGALLLVPVEYMKRLPSLAICCAANVRREHTPSTWDS